MSDSPSPAPPTSPPAGPAGDPPDRPVPLTAVPVRHYGRWVAAAVVLALLGALGYAFSQASIEYGQIPTYLFSDAILQGAGNTLLVSVLAMLLGVVLGVLFAIMRLSRNPVTSTVAWAYIWLFRGTPVLVQLLIWFNLALVFDTLTVPGLYSAPMKHVMTPFLAALLGLGINEGAYMAEIVRAGLQSVDHGQTEAAQALGMSGAKITRRIVLPQAMRVIVPPTGNEFINLLKTSSLASVIAYGELMRSAQKIFHRTLTVIELLFVISVWYLVITTVFSIGQYFLERYFGRGTELPNAPSPLRRVLRRVFTVGHAPSGAAPPAGGGASTKGEPR